MPNPILNPSANSGKDFNGKTGRLKHLFSSHVNGSEMETEEFVVTATYKQLHETTLDLIINGEIVHTTNEHPFLMDFFMVRDRSFA